MNELTTAIGYTALGVVICHAAMSAIAKYRKLKTEKQNDVAFSFIDEMQEAAIEADIRAGYWLAVKRSADSEKESHKAEIEKEWHGGVADGIRACIKRIKAGGA